MCPSITTIAATMSEDDARKVRKAEKAAKKAGKVDKKDSKDRKRKKLDDATTGQCRSIESANHSAANFLRLILSSF